jgi:hypothetical protein
VNRSKQIADRAQGDGQARILSNLQITTRHLDADYHVVTYDLTRGETGLLSVLSLIPNTTGKPSFKARVDDGSPGNRRQPELDIDIEGVSAAIERDFKANRNGYIGHHTNRSRNPDQRIYEVEIATPTGKVFDGDVSFNVTFSQGAIIPITSTLTADPNVIRATKFRQLCIRLTQWFQKALDFVTCSRASKCRPLSPK